MDHYTSTQVSYSLEHLLFTRKFNDEKQTIQTLKEFIWIQFKGIGGEYEGRMPRFRVKKETNDTYCYPGRCHENQGITFDQLFLQREVLAHEFTHKIIKLLNLLGNRGEAGAINEAIADVVAIVFKRTVCQENDWEISSFRDLSEPFTRRDLKCIDPKKYRKKNDYGYVHHNSRLISHAFYLACKENESHLSPEIFLKIWITAAMTLQKKQQTLQGFVCKTLVIVSDTDGFFRHGMLVATTVRSIWERVGFIFD